MKILYVSQYYPPESNAPANRVSALARLWAAKGEDVTVLTGFPNHPEGKIYPGYRGWPPKVEQDGQVRVVRTPIFASANRGTVLRSAAYASFCLSASAVGPFLAGRPDVVVATSPQLLTAVAGAWLSKVLRAPLVLEIRDIWPDSIVAVGALPEKHPLIGVLHGVERALYRQARHVVIVSDGFRDILVSRGVANDELSTIPNGLDTEVFSPEAAPSDPIGASDPYPGRLVVCYAGTIGMAHGLGTLLDAAEVLKATRPEVLFLVIGEGAERADLEAQANSRGLDNVVFKGRLPRDQIPGWLRRSEVSLVMLRPSELFRTVIPSKIFECMGCARPILLGVEGETRRIIEEARAGYCFAPGDARALADGIVRMIEDPVARRAMGEAGRDYALRHYDRQVLADRYRDLLQTVCSRGSGRP